MKVCNKESIYDRNIFISNFFGIFFAFFPAGLVLYWVVNNSLSIAQQYYITRHVLADSTKLSKK